MEDQEKALNSADLCRSSAINNYSGAGANAGLRADRVFVTTPLCEMVWTPRKGLSLKCADPSSIENKAPILWSPEIFNIKISPPAIAGGGKSDSSKLITGGDSTKIYLQTYSEEKICNEITSCGSPENTFNVVQSCPIWSHKYSPGTFQEMEKMKDTSLIDIARRESPSEVKDNGASSPRKNQLIANNAWTSSSVNSKGPEDGKTYDCLSHKPEEVTSNLEVVEAERGNSNKELLQEHYETNLQANNNQHLAKDEVLVYDSHFLNKWNHPEDLACTTKFKDCKQAQSADAANEDCYNGLTSHLNCLHQTLDPKDVLCSQHSSLNVLIETKSDHFNQAMVVKSECSNEMKECSYAVCQSEKTPFLKSSFTANANPLDHCKGMKKVSSVERTRINSREREDGYGSVKNSNSAEPFVGEKRARGFKEASFTRSKRMKKSSDEISCSGARVKEDSSFVNWISSVTKGFFKYDHMPTHSSALVPNSMPSRQGSLFSTSTSNDSASIIAPRNVGFGSIFKPFDWPRWKGKSKKIVNTDCLGESASSKELQLEKLIVERNSKRVNHYNEGLMLQKPVPISSVRIDQGVCQFGEPPPVVPNISVSNSNIQEKVKDDIQDNCNLRNLGSSRLSLHNGSSLPSEGKETSNVGSFILNKSSDLSIKNRADKIPVSAWITRFSPKLVAPTECTTQCNQGTSLESEKRIDECNMLLQHSQNDMDGVRDCQTLEVCHHSSLEDQKHTSENVQQCFIHPMGLFCSIKVLTDLKTKSNLNPTLPSQKLKKLESTSVFAKRLDAFRHIQTSEFADYTTAETSTCFFCGKSGHFITSCSDVATSELENLLKNIYSLGTAEKSTCLCIRCFQRNHWAAVCPYASLSSQQHVGNASTINCQSFFRTIEGRSGAPLHSNHGVRICEKSEDQEHGVLSGHKIRCGDLSRKVIDFMLQTSVNVDKNRAMKGKQIATTSGEAELLDKSYAHFHSLVIEKEPDKQRGIFERIQKLHLSRNDVTRWMESSTSHFSLEGFFVRVRLGKWEDSQEGVFYHVACISGAPGKKIHGDCKSHLPVKLGGLKCLIDCHFISNHDFIEDELKAWWSATLQGGGQLPSEEDLDKKLREKESLGL